MSRSRGGESGGKGLLTQTVGLPPMGPKRDRGGGGGKSGLSFSLLASSFPLVFANVMIR